MKINCASHQTVKFEQIKNEEALVFKWIEGYYMTIPPVATCDGESFNAINLKDGRLTDFYDEDTVQVVEAELNVK